MVSTAELRRLLALSSWYLVVSNNPYGAHTQQRQARRSIGGLERVSGLHWLRRSHWLHRSVGWSEFSILTWPSWKPWLGELCGSSVS